MKLAIIHDDFLQWGGAERLIEALAEIWPDAPIYTLAYNNTVLPETFPRERLVTSAFQKGALKRFSRMLFFLHPLYFEKLSLNEYDVVISSSTRFAKNIVTTTHTKHIAYINSPPRFLWPVSASFGPSEYIQHYVTRTPWVFRPLMRLLLIPILSWLRQLDFASAQRCDILIGNSRNVAKRIEKFYRRDSRHIYPFADIERFIDLPVRDEGYLLIISRLISHKRVDLAIQACNKLQIPLKVVGTGPEEAYLRQIAGDTIEILGFVSDSGVEQLLSGCSAFLYPQEEDFGITAVEAQAAGKPVIAYRAGGALETVVEGKTGVFFEDQSVTSLVQAIQRNMSIRFDSDVIRQHAKIFGREAFLKQMQDIVEEVTHNT